MSREAEIERHQENVRKEGRADQLKSVERGR